MNRYPTFLLLTASWFSFAQAPQIKSGGTVYIEPMDGYETYLAAAMMKKHIALVVVTDKDKADYIIRGSVAHKGTPQPAVSQPTVVVNNSNTNVINGSAGSESPLAGYGRRGSQRTQDNIAEYNAKIRALGETNVSITMVNPGTSQIVFADAQSAAGSNQLQKIAEACTKHLLGSIEKKK